MRRAGRGSTGKRERAVYMRDSTRDLFRDTVRRAKMLDDRADRTTADDVLANAVRLLRREQDRDAQRAGIDLAPPPAPGGTAWRADTPARPPSY